ncbi:cobyric acid synthase [Pleionea sp. CnH1-48]|uniref:cobyric acid synthase n=1 Tax=Pleionea sp. CnH1-48 TaxID=2954494 RepID=UPI002096EB6B|nr:cobyric acid synthase [Pleionea sp. CnH1-48]MCO7227036.1 cobyric acid synthase [Pleionea sp. CnH1-48]
MQPSRVSFIASNTLMIQGTTSNAGKSIAVAGICRVLARHGYKVAPFKPQNMALNSAVTHDGGEIGRAQALQAAACYLEPRIDFNPILLKPNSDKNAQVIVHGHPIQAMDAVDYQDYKQRAMDAVLESYNRLTNEFDAIIVEGAGSPAEINLRKGDIANMGFAEAVDCPVAIISDIDRGGVFAHLTGTLALLSDSEQQRVRGFIINKFRGDIQLLQSGLDWLEERTQRKVFGVLPYLLNMKLDAEDAINIEQDQQQAKVRIVVPVLSRISNHTDFDPLRWHPQVDLMFVPPGESLPSCDLILLPGTKNVRDDLRFLIQQGWHDQIKKHLRYGGKLMGICGGFQMLGTAIHDPNGVESSPGSSEALQLLDFETTLQPQKQLTNIQGKLTSIFNECAVTGYEIHAGRSHGLALKKPFAKLITSAGTTADDGVISEEQNIVGTYLHGLFENAATTQEILKWVCGESLQSLDGAQIREQELDRLADTFEEHLDWETLFPHWKFPL